VTTFPPWPIDGSLSARFAAQAARHPERPALIEPAGVTSYAALDAWSRRIAAAVRAAGVQVGEPVGVMVEQGAAQIAAIFGALRAGAIYVPLDAALPVSRLRTIIGDACLRTLVADGMNRSLAQWLVPGGQVLDGGGVEATAGVPDTDAEVGPNAPACIYYTSGSTGPAKGVVDSHRNVMHNVARYTHALHIGEQDRLTLLQSCGFSGAVSNIFGALLNGAALLPFDVRRHGVAALAHWLAAARPTIYHSVPSLFRQVVDTGVALPTLRVIRIEGDLGGAPDVERFQRHFNRPGQARCVLAHGLGATETGLVAQHFVTAGMPVTAGAMPVGHALPDVQIRIVDSTGRALPPGQIGEIAITGRFLASGYWQRPELTAARFTPAADGQRCYRSGDLGRIDANGELEVHGRADLLVRIHGEWIDLHGLEQALRAHPGVRDAIVTSFEAPSGAPALRAHVIADAADETGWHDTLRRALPALPKLRIDVRLVKRWPLDANGKVDRRALATQSPAAGVQAADAETPATATELVVAEVFAQTLGLERVGREDDFFDLGGDSLRAVDASLALQQRLGHGLALGAFQHASSVRGLARLLDGAVPSDDLVVLQSSGNATPLICIHGHGGNVFSMRTLARWFGPDRPVYGLQMSGLGGVGRPPLSVEAAAASHLQYLRRVQPSGPYQLAGNCFGGWIAIEMARQLLAAGEQVGALLLINPDLPAGCGAPSAPKPMIERLRGKSVQQWFKAAKWHLTEGAQQRALWKAWELGLLHSGPLATLTYRLPVAVMIMCRRYRPAPCPVQATLLVASDRPLDAGERNAWSALFPAAGCEVIDIVGTSTNLFWTPQVRDLGACIAARLRP
jgi:amino acid adenylation domain-containing protein